MEEPMTGGMISTRIADNILHNNGIIEVRLKEGAEIDTEGIKEILGATRKLAGKRKYPVLIDARVEFYTSHEARELSAQHGSLYKLAEAALVNSLAGRLIGNFYINFNKPTVPAKVFTSREEAITWLKEFL